MLAFCPCSTPPAESEVEKFITNYVDRVNRGD
jgi:hypothetical protein